MVASTIIPYCNSSEDVDFKQSMSTHVIELSISTLQAFLPLYGLFHAKRICSFAPTILNFIYPGEPQLGMPLYIKNPLLLFFSIVYTQDFHKKSHLRFEWPIQSSTIKSLSEQFAIAIFVEFPKPNAFFCKSASYSAVNIIKSC